MRVAPPPPRPAAPPRRRATVLVVVNVLPVLFSRAADGSGWRVEWNSTATAMFYRTLVGESSAYEPLFVGCPEVFVPREEEAAVEKLLEPFRCVPVFLNPTVAHNYFQGFCKGMLWPIFHNVVDVYNAAPLTLDEAEGDAQRSSPPWSAQESSSGEFVPQSCWRDPASWNPAAQDRCWADYCSVNRTFARRVVESYHEGDLIWVQDFYFLMLPSYLLRRLRNAIVTLYLHVPFPSSEVFRCLAMRTEIIRAMLCADHIGFLLFEHARHFLTSCKRMLGLNYKTNPNGMLVMEYNGREIYVSCSHVEPDMTHLFQMLQGNPDGDARAIEFRKGIEKFIYYHDSKSGNRRKKLVISSADRLEGLTGLPLKLRAFNRFLSLHPDMRKSVVLVQIGLTLDSRPNDYKQTRDYVVRFAEEINRRWGTPEEPLVVFQEKAKTTCAERMQLWQMTDIYFDTCVRGGLWLFPFEFMVVQRHHEELNAQHFVDRDRYEFGVMIASEFASYSRVLNGCLSVNPWKTEDLVNALAKAIEMTSYEKQSRFRLSYKFMEGPLESNKWGERLLEDLESTIPKKNRVSEREIIEVGFGFDFRVVQFESGFARLDVDNLVKRYSKSSRRLFIFDYGGTLSATTSVFDEDSPITYLDAGLVESVSHYGGNGSSFESNGFGDRTDQRIRFVDGNVRSPISLDLRDNLVELCSDGRNIVFVISAGHRAELEREFGSIPHLNLIADNGLFIRSGRANGWECTCENDLHLFDWKYNVKQVMIAYAGRTNGAYIRESEASLVYDYRNSDPEYGEIQSLELYEQLRRVVKREEATVCRSKGYVEVHQAGISKASVLTMILATLRQQIALPDLVFYAGDDDSDELAFRALYNTIHGEVTPENVITCTIGKKPSCAKAYADSVSDILGAVQALAIRVRLQRTRTSILPEMRRSFRDSLELLDHVVIPLSIRSLEHWGSDVDLVSASLILSESELHAADAGSLSQRLSRLVRGDVDWLAVGAAVAAGCAVGFLAAGGHKRVAASLHHRLLPPST